MVVKLSPRLGPSDVRGQESMTVKVTLCNFGDLANLGPSVLRDQRIANLPNLLRL